MREREKITLESYSERRKNKIESEKVRDIKLHSLHSLFFTLSLQLFLSKTFNYLNNRISYYSVVRPGCMTDYKKSLCILYISRLFK